MSRSWYGSFAAPCLLALLLVLQSCGGGGGGGSSGPTAPPPPLPTANITTFGILLIGPCGANTQCVYSAEFLNRGPGCAQSVKGVIRALDKDQEVIESQRFELNPAEVIRANEEFLVESCCFRVKTRDTFKFWTAKVTWTDVRCL